MRAVTTLLLVSLAAGCAPAGIPPRAIHHNRLGAELLARNRLVEAEAQLALALEYHRELPEAYNNLGLIAMRRRQPEKAADLFRQAIRLKPAFAEAHNNLGLVVLSQGKLDLAARAFAAALRVDPGYAGARYNLGATLLELGRASEAIEELRKLVAAAPHMPEAHAQLALAALANGLLAEAEQAMRRAQALGPRHPLVQRMRGEVLRAHRAFDEAERAYRLAAVLAPDDAAPRRGLALLRLDQKRPADAIPFLEEALRRAPRGVDLHLLLAAALADTAQLPAAERAARRALALSPSAPTGLALLADLLWRQDRKAEAQAIYRTFLAGAIPPPLLPAAELARRRLGQNR